MEPKLVRVFPNVVTVVDGDTQRNLVQVPQRDLYRKYNWPAKPKIQQALRSLAAEDGGNDAEAAAGAVAAVTNATASETSATAAAAGSEGMLQTQK